MSTSAPNLNTRPLPISVGLLSRRSLIGGAIVLAVALFYILVLPAIDQAVKGDSGFAVGEPYVVGGNVQITPYEGWQLDPSSNDLFSTFTKAGASFIITPAVERAQTPEEWAENTRKGLEADPENTWVVGDPQTFVTNAGDHGVSVTAHTTNNAQEAWFISTDSQSVTLLATSPDSTWATVSPEMDAMVGTVIIGAVGE